MKNTLGHSVSLTLFGESHGEKIGVVLDGMAPGIEVDMEDILAQVELRKPYGRISTQRKEGDFPRIVSGVFEGKTTGTPICILIDNENTKSKDYSKTKDLARPGHADYTGFEKYHGFADYRGGGHFSGRLTAPIVAAGAIVRRALEKKGIYIGTHILQCGQIKDREFTDFHEDISYLRTLQFPVLEKNVEPEMVAYMEAAASEGDSVGGILQTAVIGIEPGVGEPWFDSVESMLAHGLFGIPAVKGVEFGLGFGFAEKMGSQANDAFCVENNIIVTKSNNNGGINGGITNGMPIIFQCVIKPTPSIYKKQETVNFVEKTEEILQIEGRHDPAIIHRARIVVDAMTAIVLCDVLAQRFGTDWVAE